MRRYMKEKLLFGCLALLATGSLACKSDYALIPTDIPFDGCAAECTMAEASHVDLASPARSGGSAVAIVRSPFFSSPQAIVGAPRGYVESVTNERGRVYAYTTDSSNGNLVGLYQELALPSRWPLATSGDLHLGTSLLAGDLRDPQSGSGSPGTGDELMVTAPGESTSTYGGNLIWFYASATGWVSGGAFAPPRIPAGAQFGAALAFGESGNEPWLVVGAPGSDAVYILDVHRSWSSPSPFSVRQRIAAPPIATAGEFGISVDTGDYDGDHVTDIAIGAPETSEHGRVFVYRNVSSDPGFNPATDDMFPGPPAILNPEDDGSVLSTGPGMMPSRFGEALASGELIPGHAADVLLVGSPGYTPSSEAKETGAVTQFTFGTVDRDGDGLMDFAVADHRRFPNPTRQSGQNFGSSLSVGSFAGCEGSQVAVGLPGFHAGAGAVDVFMSGTEGLDTSESFVRIFRHGVDPAAPPRDARFGSALARGYIQSSPYEDLLIGAPGANAEAGHITLTRAKAGCDDMAGTWESSFPCTSATCRDIFGCSSGECPFSVSLAYDDETERLTVTFQDWVYFRAVDSGGDTCKFLGKDIEGYIEAGQTFQEIPWACGSDTSAAFSYVDGLVTVDMTLLQVPLSDGTTGFELKIKEPSLLPSDCHLEATRLDFRQSFGCE